MHKTRRLYVVGIHIFSAEFQQKEFQLIIMIPTTNAIMIPTHVVGLPNRNADCNLKLLDNSSKKRLHVRFAHQEF